MARFSDLPEELVAKILALLPVDTLIRFKCVQKLWYSVITEPRFVVEHLRNQMSDNNTCVLLKCKLFGFTFGEENVVSFISLDNKTETSRGEEHVSAVRKIVDVSFHKHGMFNHILGHSHGIICLSFESGTIVLANPSTREFRELPDAGSAQEGFFPIGLGFGYDPKSNDYKVIRILRAIAPPVHVKVSRIRIDLYTLSTDSWRQLNNVDLFATRVYYLQGFEGLYFNGACYWLGVSDVQKGEICVLLFDMSDHFFRTILVPNPSLNADKKDCRLLVLKEAIVLAWQITSASQNYFEIWFIDDLEKGTWKKLLMIGPNSRLQRALAFWKDDELIIEDKSGVLCCCNLSTQEIKNLPVQRNLQHFSAAIYMSSLVSVGGRNKLDIGDYNLTKKNMHLKSVSGNY